MAANQTRCSVTKGTGQSALGELPQEKDGLSKKRFPSPFSKSTSPRGNIPQGPNARIKELDTLLKIQRKVMFHSNISACKNGKGKFIGM